MRRQTLRYRRRSVGRIASVPHRKDPFQSHEEVGQDLGDRRVRWFIQIRVDFAWTLRSENHGRAFEIKELNAHYLIRILTHLCTLGLLNKCCPQFARPNMGVTGYPRVSPFFSSSARYSAQRASFSRPN